MRKTLIIAAMAFTAIGANAQKVKYEISGVVADSVKEVVVIVNNNKNSTQTFAVTNGKFTATGEADKNDLLKVGHDVFKGFNSLEAINDGEIKCLDSVSTIADGIAVKEPGENTFRYCSEYVDEIVTVTDDEISAAILALMEQQKLVTEGAGAVSVAAAMFNKVPVKGKKVVCLLSGGNIDVTILSRVIKRGLLMSGRSYSMNIELIDKPGQLMEVSSIIAELGGNVISIHHERANEGSAVNGCYLRIVLETRNYEHIQEIRSALVSKGFKIVE